MLWTHRPGAGPASERQQWVFGICQPDTLEFFICAVPDRTRETLEAIIRSHVRAGATVFSDGFASYAAMDWQGLNMRHVVTLHAHPPFRQGGQFANSWAIEGLWGRIRYVTTHAYHTVPWEGHESFLYEAAWRLRLQAALRADA